MILDIERFTELNNKRCNESFFPVDSWSATDWGCALAGEVGELCNFLKKIKRNHTMDITWSDIPPDAVKKEIGDIFAYLNLICIKLGINMEDAIIDKFNEVSDRLNSDIKYTV